MNRRQLLKNRSFMWYLLNTNLAALGGAVSYLAINWFVMSFQDHLYNVLDIAISFWIPMALFGPFLGVLIDRYPKVLLMKILGVIRIVIFIGVLFLLMHRPALWQCALLNAINGLLFAMILPSSMAYLRGLLGDDNLLLANNIADMCIRR